MPHCARIQHKTQTPERESTINMKKVKSQIVMVQTDGNGAENGREAATVALFYACVH